MTKLRITEADHRGGADYAEMRRVINWLRLEADSETCKLARIVELYGRLGGALLRIEETQLALADQDETPRT